MITRFYTRGQGHIPLSNFSPSPITIAGKMWPTVEHFYQAMKTRDADDQESIRLASTAKEAKRIGRSVTLREDWEAVKLNVMRLALKHKFKTTNADGQYLLDTGNQFLAEGNDWGDTYWGVCKSKGQNWLGHLLMARRDELRSDWNPDDVDL